jgi:hypothetical protein
MAQHTPGPWAVEDPMGADVGLAVVQDGLKSHQWEFIALATKSEGKDRRSRFISAGEQAANARLIAAAPDLLAACQAFIAADDFKECVEAGEMVAKAIAKATGEA